MIPSDHLLQHRLQPTDFPFRAVGGNVLLRRVRLDGRVLVLQDRQDGVLQVGEIVGLGGRWTQESKWWPPFQRQDRQRAEQLERDGRAMVGEKGVSAWKPMWRYPDSSTPRKPEPSFTPMHEKLVAELKVGDLVVFVNSRVYETFKWETEDILVYPGCWLQGIVDGSHLNEGLRRYEPEPL